MKKFKNIIEKLNKYWLLAALFYLTSFILKEIFGRDGNMKIVINLIAIVFILLWVRGLFWQAKQTRIKQENQTLINEIRK